MAWTEQWQVAEWHQVLMCLAGGYVLGCFATGYYLVRGWLGRDVREMESGNIGARNVGRVLGKWGFFLTVLGDFSKGVLAVWVAEHVTGNDVLAGMALLGVVAGHLWPLQLGFRGGKGVATSLGGLLVLEPHLTLAFTGIFLVGAIGLRKTIIPGMFAYLLLPLVSFGWERDGARACVVLALSVMVLWAHRWNLVEEIPALAARFGDEPKTENPKL